MFKIPDDSINEDEIPVKRYFKDRATVSLDDTVRNYGRTETMTTKTVTMTTRTGITPDGSNERAPVKTVAPATKEDTTTSSTVNLSENRQPRASHSAPTSLSDAFAFIKKTEFYNEKDVSEAAEQNRKRKMEKADDQPGTCKIAEQSSSAAVIVSSAAVIVSTRQRGNPLLAHMRNVVVTYRDDILPDYVLGVNTCALFLSLKYHRLHPDYIYERLRQLGKGYTVRVLLLLVDVPDSANCIQELTKMALLSSCTLLLAWSALEAARYLEAFKIYENKPPEVLQGFKDTSYNGHLNGFLTSIRGVNKSDVGRLKSEFGTVKGVVAADKSQLSAIPGIGDKKAGRIYDLFRQPFKTLDKT